MSSRGVLGFAVDGALKVGYEPETSYPSGLGLRVLRFVRQLVKDGAVRAAAGRVRDLRTVTRVQPVTPVDVAALARWTDLTVDEADPVTGQPSWYQLLRRTLGDPDAILTAGYLEEDRETALDPVWTEWGWVIDFDKEMIEVYRMPEVEGPFTARDGRWAGQEALDRVAVYRFQDLPSDEAFLTHLNRYLP